ncbi:MAG: hypothetical protein ABSH51_31210 [Solirubrobacteraceae bacterium]|jgi:hypothetical protein
MSTRTHHRHAAPRLQVAALGRLHLAVDGRSLCGRVAIPEPDIYEDEAGLLAGNRDVLERCGKCSAALVARIRQPATATDPRLSETRSRTPARRQPVARQHPR